MTGAFRPGDRLLVFYDHEDFVWHERLLLEHIIDDTWVVATPSFDLYEEDLTDNFGVERLGPRFGAPAGLRGRLFRFDRDELARCSADLSDKASRIAVQLRAAAVAIVVGAPAPASGAPAPLLPVRVRILGKTSAADIQFRDAARRRGEPSLPLRTIEGDGLAASWVFLEDRHGYAVGALVPAALAPPLAGIYEGDRGVATLPGGGIVAIGLSGTTAFTPRASQVATRDDGPDLRVLPVRYQHDQVRGRSYGDAVQLLSSTSFADWPLHGPRTTRWLYEAVHAQGTTPIQRHYWWRSILGLAASDPGVDEHKFLSEVLEVALVFDQLNGGEILLLEHIARRYQMWEEIYAQSLREAEAGAGTSDWLDERELFLGQGRSKGHALVSPLLEKHVADKLQEESSILKERRKAREERKAARPDDGAALKAGGAGSNAGGRGRGRGRQ